MPAYVYPFGARITPGEDAETIRAAQAYFLETIRPDPGAEEMLVYSLIDHTRELDQLEKAKQVLIGLALCDFLAEMLETSVTDSDRLGGSGNMQHLAKRWALGVNGAAAEVQRRLGSVNLTLQDVVAKGYALSLDRLDRLSTLMERTERRRDRVLRTIEHTRAVRSLVELRELQVRRATASLLIEATAQSDTASKSSDRPDV